MATITGTSAGELHDRRTSTTADLINALGGNDTLLGGSANDTLDGGTGNDAMAGGLGDDLYIIDSNLDVLTENANGGTDTVQSSFNWTLGANFEKLILAPGTNPVNGTGNSLANVLTGNEGVNVLDGLDGNDTIFAQGGNDSLLGGLGNDVLDAGAGNDSVSGGDGNDTLVGGAGDDTLDGGLANDTLIGGDGSDVYFIGDPNTQGVDTIDDTGATGIDEVRVNRDYTLAIHNTIENLTLTGTAVNGTGNALNNKVTGNESANKLDGGNGNDSLLGNGGNDTLIGGIGNDTLDGGGANDTLIGGDGSDVYIIGDVATQGVDTIDETGATGTDEVRVSRDYTLAIHSTVENLTLTGATAINGTGNALNNRVDGNTLSNKLDGGDGNDTLTGNGGNDTLLGGLGNDFLDGGTGTDSMAGGVGNDTYVVDSAADIVTENVGEGTDRILSTVSLSLNTAALANVEQLTIAGAATNATGNALANTLIGSASDNVLDGGAGIDSMTGGDGNDTYIVTAGDLVFEGNTATSGIDTVRTDANGLLLDNNLENLVLTRAGVQTGGGNDLANVITGNASLNIIDGFGGNDTIFGNDGNDALFGGLGDDSLEGGEGNDSLNGDQDSGHFSEEIPAGPNGNDLLRGGNGNDTLFGGLGNDTLVGGSGDDTYVLTGSNAIVLELANSGGTHDVIQSSVSYAFDGFVDTGIEELRLTGTAEIDATGDDRDNVLIGNDSTNILDGSLGNDLLQGQGGNDLLSGGQGDDTLVGGAGTDQFEGGIGNDSLSGGLNADIYYAVDDFGADIISDIDSTPINVITQENVDELHFLSASYESLWFKQVNNDLEISVVGTANKATVQGWFASTNNRVEVIFDDVGGHALSALNVANLVSAMSGFAPQTITDTSNQQLVNARNAAWVTL